MEGNRLLFVLTHFPTRFDFILYLIGTQLDTKSIEINFQNKKSLLGPQSYLFNVHQDMRSKWKGSQELREKLAASGNEEINEDREPILDGFAPDYDLKLFREAQALAAIKIEEELSDIPTDRGTR